MKTQMFTLRMADNIRKELEQISREDHVPAGQLVREAVERYLAVRRFRGLRNKILPFAEAQGLLTDEDVFKALRENRH